MCRQRSGYIHLSVVRGLRAFRSATARISSSRASSSLHPGSACTGVSMIRRYQMAHVRTGGPMARTPRRVRDGRARLERRGILLPSTIRPAITSKCASIAHAPRRYFGARDSRPHLLVHGKRRSSSDRASSLGREMRCSAKNPTVRHSGVRIW